MKLPTLEFIGSMRMSNNLGHGFWGFQEERKMWDQLISIFFACISKSLRI